MDISVVVPTMNRPDFLSRLVRYFATQRFGGKVLIGDSSNDAEFERGAEFLKQYRKQLDFDHVHFPGFSVTGVVQAFNARIPTNYVCLVPDDDFVVPAAMAGCIQFLERRADFVAVHGRGVLVSSPQHASQIDQAGGYPQPIVLDETAQERLARHLRNYSVSLFSVHRTETWRRIFSDSWREGTRAADHDVAFTDELLPCCLSVVYGKIGQIEDLYLIRQAHQRRYIVAAWYAWLTSANWQPNYARFRARLSQAVSQQDGVEHSRAETVVEQAFATYLARSIAAEPRRRVTELRQRFPVLHEAARVLNGLRDEMMPAQRLSLATLLNRRSPYYAQFLPVYEALSRPQER